MDTPTTYRQAASRVITMFGGRIPMSEALSKIRKARVPYTTIQSWEVRQGGIPEDWWGDIIRAGRKAGVGLSKADFVTVPVNETSQ